MATARYFEDFASGQTFATGGRTVTETDVMSYAYLSGDLNPIHVDEEFAKSTPFGQRLAHGQLVTILAAGMRARLGLLDGTAIAMLEAGAKYLKPIFIGDTITVKITVEETRATKKPDRGLVMFAIEILNQANVVVQVGRVTQLVKCRAGAEEASANG